LLPVFITAIIGALALAVAMRLAGKKGPDSAQLQRRLDVVAGVQSLGKSEEMLADVSKSETLSKIPWLNRWLATIDVTARLRLLLDQADLNWSVGGLLIATVFGWAGTACLLYLRFQAAAPAALLSLLYIPLPALYMLRCRRKRFALFEQQLPEALDLLVSAIRVGHSFMTAIGFLSQESQNPLKSEFQKCFEEQNFGVDLRTALIHLGARMPVPDLQIFVAAVLIQKESGGNLAEVLEGLSQTIRDRFRLKKQVLVHTAQGRATGWVLALLPVLLGVGMYLLHPEGISILWKHPVGVKLLYTAVVMNALAGFIIRHIVRIRV
jgi:tight adherence protein B